LRFRDAAVHAAHNYGGGNIVRQHRIVCGGTHRQAARSALFCRPPRAFTCIVLSEQAWGADHLSRKSPRQYAPYPWKGWPLEITHRTPCSPAVDARQSKWRYRPTRRPSTWTHPMRRRWCDDSVPQLCRQCGHLAAKSIFRQQPGFALQPKV